MYEDDYGLSTRRRARKARRNPSGAQVMEASGHTLAKAVAGTVATLVVRRVLAMRKPDGTARFTPKTAAAIQGGVAVAAALGAAASDNKLLGDVLEGTALVAGGDAGLQAAALYQIPERVQALIPGQQPATQTPAQLGAGNTNPGGWVGHTQVNAPFYVS